MKHLLNTWVSAFPQICLQFWLVLNLLSVKANVDSTSGISLPLPGDYGGMEDDFKAKPVSSKPCTTNDSSRLPLAIPPNGIVGDEFRWKHLRFYYNGDYSRNEIRRLNVAVEILHQIVPCINFEKIDTPLAESEPHVVVNYNPDHCQAYVGKQGVKQNVDLANECLTNIRDILHEWIHALGLEHEHNRPDRDEYIEVHLDNVFPEYRHAYNKVNEPEYSTFGVKYNPKSIMHYSEYDFSSNGEKSFSFKNNPDIAPDKPVSFGPFEYTGLQWSDVEKLRKMYGCG